MTSAVLVRDAPVPAPRDGLETGARFGNGVAGLAQAAAVALVEETCACQPDTTLVDAAAACGRLTTWLELTQARLTRELVVRAMSRQRDLLTCDDDPPRADALESADDLGTRSAVAQVALAGRVGEARVRSWLEMIEDYPQDHPVLWRALTDGRVGTARARLIADETLILDDLNRAWVQRQILPVAETLGLASLRGRLERLVAQADPDRYARDVDEQAAQVSFRALSHGQAAMTLTADADTIARVRATVNHRTGPATVPTDPGDRGDRQAEAVIDLLSGPVRQASIFDRPADATSDDTPPDDTPPDDTPPDGGQEHVRAVPSVCLNVTVPLSVLRALAEGEKHPSTALGLVELEGHGLIPAALARQIIVEHGARATWRCHYIDDRPGSPAPGAVVGVGSVVHDTGYTPPPLMAELVRARDRHCRFPGCRRAARACDLDHVRPHAHGGVRCSCNLMPLCRHHHRLKTHARFTPELDPVTGSVSWTTPTGHRYTAGHEYPLPVTADPPPHRDQPRYGDPPPF